MVRLIGLVAAGGYGKSLLALKVFKGGEAKFTQRVWSTFSQPYSFAVWGRWLLEQLLGQSLGEDLPEVQLLNALFTELDKQPCLLVLDNVETLLTSEQIWQDPAYGRFLLRLLGTDGRCKVLLTSREQPELPGNVAVACRWKKIGGISVDAGVKLLKEWGLAGEIDHFQNVVRRADGHPLLLNLIAGSLQEEYGEQADIGWLERLGGNLLALIGLHQGNLEASIQAILQWSLERINEASRLILLRCSVLRQPFTATLAGAMVAGDVSSAELRGLAKRSLLQAQNTDGPWFFEFQPLIQRYLQQQLRARQEWAETHRQAIQVYLSVRKPELDVGDSPVEMVAYLEVFHHHCELGEKSQALALLDWQTQESDRYSSCNMRLQLGGA